VNENTEHVRKLIAERGWTEQVEDLARYYLEMATDRGALRPRTALPEARYLIERDRSSRL
jgi:hypothetical protein